MVPGEALNRVGDTSWRDTRRHQGGQTAKPSGQTSGPVLAGSRAQCRGVDAPLGVGGRPGPARWERRRGRRPLAAGAGTGQVPGGRRGQARAAAPVRSPGSGSGQGPALLHWQQLRSHRDRVCSRERYRAVRLRPGRVDDRGQRPGPPYRHGTGFDTSHISGRISTGDAGTGSHLCDGSRTSPGGAAGKGPDRAGSRPDGRWSPYPSS